MNIKRLMPYCLLAGLLAFSACEKGQMADMEKQGTELPEGKYPLTFIAVQAEATPEGTPQTRVSENTNGMSSHWDGGEVINVQIADGKAGTYTLDENGKAKAQTPCYWQNTNNATINAWYSNISEQNTETNTDKIVSLSDQSKGLAYVLKATVNDVSYNSQDIELKFHHQLAKVRVKLTGNKANDVKKVEVKAYASCNVAAGNVTPNGNIQYIQIHKHGNSEYYEANLVPMKSITSNDFIKLNGNTQATINNITELKAGNVYTIEIDVKPATPNPDDLPDEITSGEYTVSGTGSKTITINGNPKITLDGVTLNAENGTAIKVLGGTPTIILKGENKFTSDTGEPVILLDGDDANIILDGTDGTGKLTIQDSYNASSYTMNAVIGGKNNMSVGDITIQNMTLNIDCSECKPIQGAVIGSGFGFGSSASCGNIIITNTDLTVTAKTLDGAVIGAGSAQNEGGKTSCKSITITPKVGESRATFEGKLKVTEHGMDIMTTKPEKIGKGGTFDDCVSTCGSITWN